MGWFTSAIHNIVKLLQLRKTIMSQLIIRSKFINVRNASEKIEKWSNFNFLSIILFF